MEELHNDRARARRRDRAEPFTVGKISVKNAQARGSTGRGNGAKRN